METELDIKNNLDIYGNMNFQKHPYKWSSNISVPDDNITIRFKYYRAGNRDNSYMFHHDRQPDDYFKLNFKGKQVVVQVQSKGNKLNQKEFQLSDGFDKEYTWFAFSFFKDKIDVFYDTKFIGSLQTTINLKQFSYPQYLINEFNSYNENNIIRGYMSNLQLYTDIYSYSFIENCIGAGKPIYIKHSLKKGCEIESIENL